MIRWKQIYLYFVVTELLLNCVVFQGQATDIQIQAAEILKLKKTIHELYAKHTKQPLETIGKY